MLMPRGAASEFPNHQGLKAFLGGLNSPSHQGYQLQHNFDDLMSILMVETVKSNDYILKLGETGNPDD